MGINATLDGPIPLGSQRSMLASHGECWKHPVDLDLPNGAAHPTESNSSGDIQSVQLPSSILQEPRDTSEVPPLHHSAGTENKLPSLGRNHMHD